MKTIHIFLIFIVIVLLQLFVPAKMIIDREGVLKNGTVYKFKTKPIDPSDPFRGKYVTLNYELDKAEILDSTLQRGDKILVYLDIDSLGFAQLHSVSQTQKNIDKDFVEAKVHRYNLKTKSLSFDLEFNRYYMEESKAKPAEDVYRTYNRRQDTLNTTYALVADTDGKAELKEVLITDKPILYYIEKKGNQ
jgi:uncharacterized membrane-anchored protein